MPSALAGKGTCMSDGGAIVNEVRARHAGEEVTVEVIASHETVEIGGWTFDRDDLLFALGVQDTPGRQDAGAA